MDNIKIPKYVRFKGWQMYKGWDWIYGGEGKVVAETNSQYKVKTSILFHTWVNKEHCEEITFK